MFPKRVFPALVPSLSSRPTCVYQTFSLGHQIRISNFMCSERFLQSVPRTHANPSPPQSIAGTLIHSIAQAKLLGILLLSSFFLIPLIKSLANSVTLTLKYALCLSALLNICCYCSSPRHQQLLPDLAGYPNWLLFYFCSILLIQQTSEKIVIFSQ